MVSTSIRCALSGCQTTPRFFLSRRIPQVLVLYGRHHNFKLEKSENLGLFRPPCQTCYLLPTKSWIDGELEVGWWELEMGEHEVVHFQVQVGAHDRSSNHNQPADGHFENAFSWFFTTGNLPTSNSVRSMICVIYRTYSSLSIIDEWRHNKKHEHLCRRQHMDLDSDPANLGVLIVVLHPINRNATLLHTQTFAAPHSPK